MRKLLLTTLGCCMALAASAQIRIEWPWGGEWSPNIQDILRVVADPLSTVVPTAVPTQASLTAFVLTNPDKLVQIARDPRYLAYMPVADAMVNGRNSVVAHGGRKIPPQVRKALRGHFSDGLLDSIRWTTDWNLVKNTLQTAQMFANKDTQAITLLNAIVFRNSDSVDDIALWAHELHHAQQYAEWGVLEFAKQWVDNSSVNGPVERPAYEKQRQIEHYLSATQIDKTQVVATSQDCKPLNASMAACDLYVANDAAPVLFTVSGTARARGAGTRSGSMALLLMHDGAACNSDTQTHGVDNETYLQGGGYMCQVRLQPGQTTRVLAVAPNNRADAVATTLDATRSTSLATAPSRPRKSTMANCSSLNASIAYCDLRAGDDVGSVDFIVEGRARARGDGTRSGAMRLVMSTSAGACNSGASVSRMVDNATELSGSDYVCRVSVRSGQEVRVTLEAPNSRADAEWIRASASY